MIAHINHPLNRTGYALTTSSAAGAGIGLAYWLLAARLYPTEVVGRNAAAIAAMTLVSGIAMLSLDAMLVRFIPRAGRAATRLVGQTYLITAFMAAILSSAFLATIHVFLPALRFLTTNIWLVLGFVLATVCWSIFVEQDAVLTGLHRATWVPIENISFSLLKLALLGLFASRWENLGIFASWTIPAIIAVPFVSYLVFRHLLPRHVALTREVASPLIRPELVKFTSGNYVGFLCYSACSTLPPLIILREAGSVASAYFYPPWMISGMLSIFAVNMSIALTVESSFDVAKLREYFRHGMISVTRLVLPLVAILFVIAHPLLRLFGSGYANHGVTLLRLLVLASLPQMLVALKIGAYRSENRVRPVVFANALIAIVTLGLSIRLLNHHGIWSVGAAYLTAQSIAAVCLFTGDVRDKIKGDTKDSRVGDR